MAVLNKKTFGYGIILIFGLGLWVLYTYVQHPASHLPDDPQAVQALDLVKNHLSREGYTLAQALQMLVDELEAKSVPHKEGEWQVAHQGPDTYVVRKIVREKGSMEWIEREFAWRVNLKDQSIRVISLAAQQLMPFENLPPLPHGEEISSLSRNSEKEGRPG